MRKKIIIMGAAGRDFHNFNVLFRNNKEYEVVCFTAEQIPGIDSRRYPKELSGKLYKKGIPIYPESKLTQLIKKHKIDEVILSYSDLSAQDVLNKLSLVNAAGADFKLVSAESTMIKSKKKIISICAVRTGCGKSQTTRKIASILKSKKKKFVIIRHPMPYGKLEKQIAQRFATLKDLDKHDCTIEEREEYEHHIRDGYVVYAGVDYEKILKMAEKEADVIIWDGGNNDTPFYKPDIHFVVTDPLRSGHESGYYPGQTNLRLADFVIINKENSATKFDIKRVVENVSKINPKAKIIHADSITQIETYGLKDYYLKGAKVVVVEDGPTLTHGGMNFGAGFVVAKKHKAKIINPKKHSVGSIKKLYEKYPNLGPVIPAMGYYPKQLKELKKTIENAKPKFVIEGTPIDLNLVLDLSVPIIHVKYYLKEKNVKLESILKKKRFI